MHRRDAATESFAAVNSDILYTFPPRRLTFYDHYSLDNNFSCFQAEILHTMSDPVGSNRVSDKKLLKFSSSDFELDEMTANEVNVETCLDILRLADLYGMHRSQQQARALALEKFEEVRNSTLRSW